ncbi:MAG: hypothetical protein Q4D07_10240 [Selenomonadaceae bacterium]|nr:hypothetical protein [Selenomonadaceae bacterium]
MTIAEKLRWLKTAENFLNLGNISGARNALQEILSTVQFPHDPDTLAFAAELALYSGDKAAAEEYLRSLTAATLKPGGGLPHGRGEFVRALLELSVFEIKPAVRRLESILRQPAIRQPQNEYDKCTRVRVDKYLSDACYLLGDASGAAAGLFDAASVSERPEERAALYSKALFLTAYNPLSPSEELTVSKGYNRFFENTPPVSVTGRSVCQPEEARLTKQRSEGMRTIRIGYISRDFRRHAMGYFLAPILKHFDRKNTIVFAYMTGEGDEVTKRLRRLGAAFTDVSDMSPEQTARRIAADRLDVLVDLSGHSQDNALPVLAYRPAPVIISGLGFLHTSGLAAVDYHLTDRIMTPAAAPDSQAEDNRMQKAFSERLLYVDAGIPPEQRKNDFYPLFCYAPVEKEKMPPPAAPEERQGKHITFGCLNNYAKLTDRTLLMWRSIMEKLPDSRLILQNKLASLPDFAGRQFIVRRLGAMGFDTARIECRPYSPDYLKTYADIDIALDTEPYNGGATTCEALYMGVPVVTLAGTSPAARVGASILFGAGCPELISYTEKEYISIAVRLAEDRQRLDEYRKNLRRQMEQSPLMDERRYAAAMEALCRKAYKEKFLFV